LQAGSDARLFSLEPMTALSPDPPQSRLEPQVRHIRALIEQRAFAQALDAAQRLLIEVPQNRDLLYMQAVSERYLGQIPQALATLARLEEFHPNYSRLYQERGHCHVTRREAEPAIAAFLKAVHLNPALPGSWNSLQTLFRMTGRTADAEVAAGHVATLAGLPVAVVTASSMFADGEVAPAEAMIRKFLLEHGDHIEAMRLLAKIGLELGVLDDAETLLAAILQLAPDYRAARFDYARVLLDRQRPLQARAQLDLLLKDEPRNVSYRTAYATATVALGELERAVALYREILREEPNSPGVPEIRLSIGHALKTLGRTAEAIECYRSAGESRQGYGDAYWSLANLKTYRFTDDEITAMRAFESAPATHLVDRLHLCFALGKALEDRADYGESFRYYERGNQIKRAQSRYKPQLIERNAKLQREVCTREFFAARTGVGCQSDEPIFIVGLPRSGSTLLEQILASHSAVEGTMELAEIPRIVAEMQGRAPDDAPPRYPGMLTDLSPEDFKGLGERYLAETRAYRSGKPHFIDKMPNNFRHIGLIHLILPRARIIDARREAVACCFSNYKQLFATGQEFTYSIEDITRYYRSYVELMRHWDEVLPGRVLRVQHEDVVADLEASVRRLLEFCGLPFEPACLEFYKTERSVRTASSEQVRRPLYKESIEQWRHFAPWLAPLRAALGELAPAAVAAQA
jgi:tetratricopeptide (TPR) repeat protein